ncbi:ATP-binding protein [Tissierella carlieri]|uniref:histidine kinase n=1 Tax=Tissierella carlieri TaxID=689904 RepID=A0ABT1S4X3_9FIRM|nr:ATP-binding protein [Tissierella carlieri]MCQ4921509.1 ATP-binding protein [Tissierella carlieri]
MDKLNNSNKIVPISVSARLIHQLGEQLITDEHVALLELIKNAYDADATIVKVEVDTNVESEHGLGIISISDNGNGMIPSIIEKGFLDISTNFKKKNKITPFFGRRVLGNKGLGRLSFHRLGDYINTTTTPRIDRYEKFINENKETIITEYDREVLKDYNTFDIIMQWSEFEDDKKIDEVTANVKQSKIDIPKYGTDIKIYNIKNPSFWNLKRTDEQKLKSEIFGMVNPFFKENNSKFQIYLKVNDKLYTNEKIDEDILDQISDVKVAFEFKDWKFNIEINRKIRYYERLRENTINNMKRINYELDSIENNFSILESAFTVDLNDLEVIMHEFPYLKDVLLYNVNDRKAYPGSFKGTLYATDFSIESKKQLGKIAEESIISSEIKTYDEIKNIWESANGFYVFRNDFRILPYGKREWAGFTKKSQTFKSNIYKEHTIAGYINIDGDSSENLIEQTNRQGLIENEYGRNFLTLIQAVLTEIIVRDDVEFRDGFTFRRNEMENPKVSTKNKILMFNRMLIEEEEKDEKYNEIISSIDSIASNLQEQDNAELIKHQIKKIYRTTDKLKDIDNKIKNKNEQEKYIQRKQIEELTELLPVVGQGIIIESLTHELNRIEENIRTHATNTKKYIDKLNIEGKNELSVYQQRIIDETVYLRQQLNHLEPTYRRNRQKIELISIKQFIEETYMESGPMMKKALDNNVKVTLTGDDFLVKVNRGYLITVFDNIFLNSLFWIDTQANKEITFEINKNGTIIYYDSGPGIHEKLEKSLFEPFESMKPNGRGLGLYIVKELLNTMNALIELNRERRDGRLYKFNIKFMNVQGE